VNAFYAAHGARALRMGKTMRTSMYWAMAGMIAATVTVLGCSKEEPKPEAPARKSVEPKPVLSAAPAPSAAPKKKLRDDCPQGSSGEGAFSSPCEASGNARMMEVQWTKKIDTDGPKFRVQNLAQRVILYGKIAVYFYDKAGKQIEIKDSGSGKPRPYLTCGGNMFGGVMKPGEKAYFYFSCVKKDHVPEGATTIEAEMQSVGFADASEKSTDLYWRNENLTPDERPKGGVK
jgi:hypothetical protein